MEKIIRQGSWIIGAQVLARTVSFFYTIFLANKLGVANFGLYSVALAYFALISAAADFGFSRFLIRELSRDINKVSHLVINIILLRLTLASILFAGLGLILYSIDPDKIRISLVLIAVIAVLPQTIASVLDGIFVAIRKLRYSAIALFLSALSNAIIGFYLVNSYFGAVGALVALIVGQSILVLILWFFLVRMKAISLNNIRHSTMKEILIGSLPYGLLGILGMLYFRIDTVLLTYLRGSFETGLYSAGYKFLDAIIFVPSALSTAIFPVLAKLHDQNPNHVKELYFKSLKIMTFLGALVLVGYLVLIPEVIRIFLPNYIRSIMVIIILSFSIPFIFAHACAIQVLFSTDKYFKKIILLSCLTLSFNVVANLIFIPIYGLYAAAVITTVSEILSFLVFFFFLKWNILDKR